MSAYKEYTTADDRKCAHALIEEIFDAGCTISVNDGEEWTLLRSSSVMDVKSHLATTGEDFIRIYKRGDQSAYFSTNPYKTQPTDQSVGWFELIWDNGSEGDPLILISDYSANEFCDSVYNKVKARVEA